MIKIQVDSVTPISKILPGRRFFVDMESGAKLIDLLRKLTKDYGQEFYDAVCSEDGYDEQKISLLVNGVSVIFLGGVDIQLKDGDAVLILPLLCGG